MLPAYKVKVNASIKELVAQVRKYDRLLVITTHDKSMVGTWVSTAYAHIGNNLRFCVEVNLTDLVDVKFDRSLASSTVLVNDSPHSLDIIIDIGRSLDFEYNLLSVFHRLVYYDSILSDDLGLYTQQLILLETNVNLMLSLIRKEKYLTKDINKTFELYIASNIVDPNLSQLAQTIADKFQVSIMTERFAAYPDLPEYNESVIHQVITLFLMFNDKINLIKLTEQRRLNTLEVDLTAKLNLTGDQSKELEGRFYSKRKRADRLIFEATDRMQAVFNAINRLPICAYLIFSLDSLNLELLPRIVINCLDLLARQEIKDVLSDVKITGNEVYIFPITLDGFDSHRESLNVQTYANAMDNLDYFVGFAINELDLSQSYLTGSCIPACCHVSRYKSRYYIDTFYPGQYTIPNDYNEYRNVIKQIRRGGELHLSQEGHRLTMEMTDRKGETQTLTLRVINGADVDIAVDVVDDTEFDQIAQRHFTIISKHLGGIMTKHHRKTSYIWEIETSHRTFQIYRANRTSILRHHVSMVRGYVTQDKSNKPMIYLSASCLWSYDIRRNYNYFYFISKASAMEIILKYQQRGFTPSTNPRGANNLIEQYCKLVTKWTDFQYHSQPSIRGEGTFNVFNYQNELTNNQRVAGASIMPEDLDDVEEVYEPNEVEA